MKKLYPLAVIHWIDAARLRGWQHIEEIEHAKPSEIVTIGFLVRETKAHVSISDSCSVEGSVSDPLSIPKGCILSRGRLKTPPQAKFGKGRS